tara:strand:+ start:173 stop:520 length:348 start_codon:yes stop_codon:yes gene_type:complete
MRCFAPILVSGNNTFSLKTHIFLIQLYNEDIHFSYAGRLEMEKAAKTIPGIADAAFQGNASFWVVMSTPNAQHDYDRYGYMFCNGGEENFGVKKGYTITFWNAYTKKPIKKFRCY